MTAGDLYIACTVGVIDRRYSGFSSDSRSMNNPKNIYLIEFVASHGSLRDAFARAARGFGVRFRRLPPDVGLPRSISIQVFKATTPRT